MTHFESPCLAISSGFQQSNCWSLELALDKFLSLGKWVFESDFTKSVSLDKSACIWLELLLRSISVSTFVVE